MRALAIWIARFVGYLSMLGMLGEVALRLTWTNPHSGLPVRGVQLKENQRAIRNQFTYHGSPATFETDEDGFVQPSRTVREQPYRIAFMGDSSVEAGNIPTEARWPNLVIAALRGSGLSNADALIDAHAGCTARDAVELFYNKDAFFAPQILLYSSGFTDLAYNLVSGQDFPRYLQSGGEHCGSIERCCYLYAFAQQRWTVGVTNPVRHGAAAQARLYPVDCSAAVAAYRRNLSVLVHTARVFGCRVYLLTQPSLYGTGLMSTEPERLATIRYKDGGIDEASLAKAMDDVNQAIREVGRSEGVTVIDTVPTVSKNLDCLSDEVHLTELGNQRVAEAVLQRLIADLHNASERQPPR